MYSWLVLTGSNLLSFLLQALLKNPLKIIDSEQQGILLSGCQVESKRMMSIRPVMFSPPKQLSSCSFPSAVADVVANTLWRYYCYRCLIIMNFHLNVKIVHIVYKLTRVHFKLEYLIFLIVILLNLHFF